MIARRETKFLSDGTYLFEDQLEIKGVFITTVLTCTGWLLEIYELKAGEIFFASGKMKIHPRGRTFAVFYPPFTLVRPCFKNAKGRLLGMAGTESLPARFTAAPIIFETTFPKPPKRAREILEAARSLQPIDANPKASLLSIKAKKLINEGRSSSSLIGRIAARLGVSNEHLSRQFKRDYGMSPRTYLHQLRIADVPLQLAMGGEITDVSHDSGYGDLSRFYKQFQKATKTSPGVCRKIVSPSRGR